MSARGPSEEDCLSDSCWRLSSMALNTQVPQDPLVLQCNKLQDGSGPDFAILSSVTSLTAAFCALDWNTLSQIPSISLET